MKTLLIAPHNDDETLFCSHAISRYNADLLVVYDSYLQLERDRRLPLERQLYRDPSVMKPDVATRRFETQFAFSFLSGGFLALTGVKSPDPEKPQPRLYFVGLDDSRDYPADLVAGRIRAELPHWKEYEHVFRPAIENGGHDQHNLVAMAADRIFGGDGFKVTKYYTYTRHLGKTDGHNVMLNGTELRVKFRALACYGSQIERDDCRPHFLREQEEYVA